VSAVEGAGAMTCAWPAVNLDRRTVVEPINGCSLMLLPSLIRNGLRIAHGTLKTPKLLGLPPSRRGDVIEAKVFAQPARLHTGPTLRALEVVVPRYEDITIPRWHLP